MTTAIASLFTAIEAALNASPPVCGLVTRARMRSYGVGEDLAVNIKPGPTDPTQPLLGDPRMQLVTGATIECYARTTSATPYDVAADGLLLAVFARLQSSPLLHQREGFSNLEFGGIDYDAETHGDQAVCLSLPVSITHYATTQSLE